MPIKPKYNSLKYSIPKESRKFTDREEFIQAFENALQRNKFDEHNILVFFGVGGIGKTTLRKELIRLIDAKYADTIRGTLDFELPAYREEETALYYLRNCFKENYNIQFPSFELAYAVYWKKTRPQISMNKNNFTLLDEGGIVTDIVSIAGEIPLIGLIPRVTKTVLKGHKYLKEWWTKRGQRELYNLPELEAKDILERMPMFFASDLKDHIFTKQKQCVIFIDTFEALWENIHSEGGYFKKDDWIRELVSQLPEVLWVIGGREKLRWSEIDADWEKCIEQHLIGGLSYRDSGHFLNSCDIRDEKITDTIVTASKGVPYYLDLAVDTYYLIKLKHNKEPEELGLARTQEEVLDRFLKYLDRTEIETLKVLSSARLWDREIFQMLVDEFKTGYPVSAFGELCRFSFINEGQVRGTYAMHNLMTESLQNRLDKSTLERTKRFLFEYYNRKLINLEVKNIADEHFQAVKEAFYYGKKSMDANEFYNWFIKICDIFGQAAKRSMMMPLFEEFLSVIETNFGNEHHYYTKGLHMLSALYEFLGKYQEAESNLRCSLKIKEKLYGLDNLSSAHTSGMLGNILRLEAKYSEAELQLNRAIETGKKFLGLEHPDLAQWMNFLAILYYEQGRYSEAEPLFKKAIEIGEKTTGIENADVVQWINNLGTLHVNQGRFSDAVVLLKKSLEVSEKIFGNEHPEVANRQNNLALLYYETGEHSQAESLFKRATDIGFKTYGEGHPELMKWYSNLALVYYKQGRYSESEQLMKSVLSESEKTLGPEHPFISVYLNNLAGLYSRLGRFENCEEILLRAIDISKKNYGEFHPDLAMKYNSLATLYFRQGKYTEAEPLYRNAISISEKTVGEEHPDFASWLTNLALLYLKQLKYAESETLFKKAINIFENSLGAAHLDLSKALQGIADLYYDQKRFSEAELNYCRALDIIEKAVGERHQLMIETLRGLSKTYKQTGQINKSIEVEKRIIQLESKQDISSI